jgi:hypothetical protein
MSPKHEILGGLSHHSYGAPGSTITAHWQDTAIRAVGITESTTLPSDHPTPNRARSAQRRTLPNRTGHPPGCE